MTDAVCHSGSATPTHSADGSDDVLRLAGTKAVNNLAARAQLLDPAPLVQYQDRSLGFPITWLANCLVGQANWLVRRPGSQPAVPGLQAEGGWNSMNSLDNGVWSGGPDEYLARVWGGADATIC
ncbi:hypothetical protein MRX96_046410 [Rhipicephalus microplus]